jgi:hypothetical protein
MGNVSLLGIQVKIKMLKPINKKINPNTKNNIRLPSRDILNKDIGCCQLKNLSQLKILTTNKNTPKILNGNPTQFISFFPH